MSQVHLQSLGRAPDGPFGFASLGFARDRQGRSFASAPGSVLCDGGKAHPFGSGLELAHPISVVLLLDERSVLAPLPGPAIAQPEEAGADIGRQLHGVVRRHRLAAMGSSATADMEGS